MPELERQSRLPRRQVLKATGALAAAAALAGPPVGSVAAASQLARGPTAAGVAPALPALEVIALNRLAFGPRPGDLDAFRQLAGSDRERLIAYVDLQLNPQLIDDSACSARLDSAGFVTLGKSMPQLWSDHVTNPPEDHGYQWRNLPLTETIDATMIKAVYSRRQLQEVLVDFWHNHFNVFRDTDPVQPTFVHYDRDVIRANALGNFRKMIEDVGTSPAMLFYLDNNSNQVAGPNENYARELFELHTLGAENYLGVQDPRKVKSTGSGWVGRHLASLSEGGLLPAVAAGGALPTTLAGAPEAVSISAIDDFDLRGDPFQKAALRHLYDGDTWLHTAGAQTFQAIDTIQRASSSRYEPANGAVYPNGGFGANLKTVAKLMKLGVGLRAATVDLGGWDTHQAEGEGSGGYLSHLVAELSDGLGALYTDLDGSDSPNYADRMTLVVVSEFGRRLSENASRGTDHGHGSGIFVLGGQVNGGRVISNWPGLQNEQLYDRADLAVTIDYRQVLGEILVRRLGNPRMAAVFPGYKDYQPLGIVRGTDLQLQA